MRCRYHAVITGCILFAGWLASASAQGPTTPQPYGGYTLPGMTNPFEQDRYLPQMPPAQPVPDGLRNDLKLQVPGGFPPAGMPLQAGYPQLPQHNGPQFNGPQPQTQPSQAPQRYPQPGGPPQPMQPQQSGVLPANFVQPAAGMPSHGGQASPIPVYNDRAAQFRQVDYTPGPSEPLLQPGAALPQGIMPPQNTGPSGAPNRQLPPAPGPLPLDHYPSSPVQGPSPPSGPTSILGSNQLIQPPVAGGPRPAVWNNTAQEQLPPPQADPQPLDPSPIQDGTWTTMPCWTEPVGCPTCYGGGGCVECDSGPLPNTRVGRFFHEIYMSICCPDECYTPKWTPLQDAAFFADSARPSNTTRIRYDHFPAVNHPDRAEFFIAQSNGTGRGIDPANGYSNVPSLDYESLMLYHEAAINGFSFFTAQRYVSLDPVGTQHESGFGDMQIGTKSLLFDRELVQVAFQFTTHIPIGSVAKGLGTGHVSLEPSVLFGLNIGPRTYGQAQVAQWIPIGGDDEYQGGVLHYHFSLNQVLYHFRPKVPLVSTFEFSGWSFQSGAFTNDSGAVQNASDTTFAYAGVGLRLFICDKIDFGMGSHFALTQDRWSDHMLRTEFRWRF